MKHIRLITLIAMYLNGIWVMARSKKTIISSFFIFSSFFVYSQTCPTTAKNPWEWPSHSNWFIGNGIKGKFSGGSLTISTITNITSYEGTTGASDDKGNLLFLANGRLLWDANGNLKYAGLLEGNENGSTTVNGSAAQGILSTRHPLDTANYYIFTTDDALTGTANGLNYFVFDRNGNLKSGPTRLGTYRTTEGIAATKHANGVDIWVSVWASNTNNFYTYLITCTGVISTPVISSVAPNTLGDMNKERGGVAFSWDSKYFAQVHGDYSPNANQDVSVYLFDNKTGIISDPHDIADPVTFPDITSPYDVLFSPDNSKLYVSTSQGKLCYYDITSWNTATMSASFKAIAGVSTGSHSAIEIGGDGNLYMATLSAGLGKLTGSMNAGTLTYSNIAGAITNRGLPTMYIPPYEEPDILEVGPFCSTDPAVDLSTIWLCSGLNAEDTIANPNAYSGKGITNAGTGIFSPALAGIGTHQIIFKRCSVDDTTYIIVKACSCPDTALSPIPPMCAGDTINLNAYKITTEAGTWSITSTPAGSTVSITGNTFYSNNSMSGNYTVRFTLKVPVAGCPDFAERTIKISALPIVVVSGRTIVCQGQSTILTVSGANTYTWSPVDQGSTISVSPVLSTSYTVTGTDTNGCSNTASYALSVSLTFTLSTTVTDATCFGLCNGSATVTAIGGTGIFAYSWSSVPAQTTATANTLCSGTYTVTVADSDACTATITAVITQPTPIILSTAKTDPTCVVQGTATVTANGGAGSYTYLWSDNQNQTLPTATGLGVGTYTVLVTDANLCTQSISVSLTNPALPIATFNFVSACFGTPVPFTDNSTSGIGNTITGIAWDFGEPSSGANNTWNTSTPPPHLYASVDSFNVQLKITTSNGCVDSISKWVKVWPIPVISFNTLARGCMPVCANFTNSSTIAGGIIAKWTWDFGDAFASSVQSPTHCYTNAGTYNVTLTAESGQGCKSSQTMNNLVNVYPVPKAAFTANPAEAEIFNPIISLLDQSIGNPVIWHWDFGIPNEVKDTSSFQNPVWTYTDTGTFNVCLHTENKYGCSDNICHPVHITPYWTFYIPNAFSPNGDGIDDAFNGKGYNITEYQLWVFDRWGNMIYTTGLANNPESSIPWDGKANHGRDIAQEDVYVWKVKLKDVFNKTHGYVGSVTIVK